MSPFDVFRKTLTVKRYATGAYNASTGMWANGAESETEIKASVQPATADDMEVLPENRRRDSAYRLYTEEPFTVVSEGTQNPDLVVIDGEDYEIARCEPWKNGLITNYKSLAVRVQP